MGANDLKDASLLQSQEHTIATPAFAKWFGRSKVVNDDGTPLVVYHGTKRDFGEFSARFLGANVMNPTTRFGFYFTESADGASRWAERTDRRARMAGETSGQNIMPVYLSIQNPRSVSAEKFNYFLRSAREKTIDKFVLESIEKGYDGLRICYQRSEGGSVDAVGVESWWVAFNAEQIKSAIGNRGTFDMNNPSILHSITAGAAALGHAVNPIGHDLRESAQVGQWVELGFSDSRGLAIAQVREMHPDELYLSELTEDGRLQPEKRQYLQGYIDRLRNGEAPPLLDAIEMEDGRIRVVDGTRRAMAAKALGQTVRLLVSPLVHVPGEGKVPLTRELAASMPNAAFESQAPMSNPEAVRTAIADLVGLDAEQLEAGIGRLVVTSSDQVADQVQAARKAAFDAWFEGSKIADADGKPLVMYHGATSSFTRFNTKKIGARDPGFFGSGFYFAPSEEEAQGYADSAAEADGLVEAGVVIPAWLSLRNPFVWDMEPGDGAAGTRKALASFGVERSSVRGDSAALGNPEERKRFNKALRNAGHDGVVVRDEDGIREVVAFYPEQIKSATSNRGTYDPRSPDITHSLRAAGPSAELHKLRDAAADAGRKFLEFVAAAHTSAGDEPDGEKFMSLSEALHIAEQQLATALANLHDDGFALKAFTSDGRMLVLNASAQRPGYFQLTRFDRSGAPWGDTQFRSKSQAVEVLIEEADLATISDFDGLLTMDLSRFANSVGLPIAASDEALQAFRHWFGQSKAVDAEAKPLVLYHGTNAHAYSEGSIEVFNTRPASGRGGAFFSSSKDLAQQYGERVYEVYLSLQNPLIVHVNGGGWSAIGEGVKVEGLVTGALRAESDKAASEMTQLYAELDELFDEPSEAVSAKPKVPVGAMTLQGLNLGCLPGLSGDGLETDAVVKAARRLGFDGVIFKDVLDSPTADVGYARVPSDVYVAFKPEQIKSAACNSGAFDMRDPDITHSLAAGELPERAQAFHDRQSGATFFLADRIQLGKEASVFLHETVHRHGKAHLPEGQFDALVGQVKAWAGHAQGSTERSIHDKAAGRVAAAGVSGPVADEELFAYAVEEAVAMGVQPSALAHEGSAEAWLSAVVQSIQRVADKLIGNSLEQLDGQDLVDLAYALAQVERPELGAVVEQAFMDCLRTHEAVAASGVDRSRSSTNEQDSVGSFAL